MSFLIIPKVEATFSLVKQIEEIYFYKEEKGPYTNNVERIDPVSTTKYVKKLMKNKWILRVCTTLVVNQD